jgi:agmatine deiminase
MGQMVEEMNEKKHYHMPAEWTQHEGTWLQWPNDRILRGYERDLERIWLSMVDALHEHENVHILVCDEQHQEHVASQLEYYRIGLNHIDFSIIPTTDVWARDNGPIFVLDEQNELAITDWMFNGWGGRYEWRLENEVPGLIGTLRNLRVLKPKLVLEGGGVEVNGTGSFMATRSSILNANRNPGKSQEEVEKIIGETLGVSHFIWLTGSTREESASRGDVTDAHIDGAARFTNETTVLYNQTEDPLNPIYPVCRKRQQELEEATTEAGRKLTMVPLPIPEPGVYRTVQVDTIQSERTTGTYCNYYVANEVVLVPVFGSKNDERAKRIIGEQFPTRQVIGINVLGLVDYGGAIHCVTQQQPLPQRP